jgi:hypothetical protein
MNLTVKKITQEHNADWDNLIKTSPQGSTLLLTECLLIWVETEPELHLLRLGCYNEKEELVGGQAFLFRYLAPGIRVGAVDLDIGYSNSPIIAMNVVPSSTEYFEIIQALADKVNRLGLHLRIYCHPSIQDIRPLLQRGWSAEPAYSHIWDLREPEILLKNLRSKHKKRFHHETAIRERLDFAEETGVRMIDEFIPLYQTSAKRTGIYLSKTWDAAMRKRMEWMLTQNAIRFFTCRKKTGEILSIATVVVSKPQNSCYGWLLANDLLQGEKEYIPITYLHTIENLSREHSFFDIAEGVHPTLYAYKDSLGTASVPYYIMDTPSDLQLRKIMHTVKRVAHAVQHTIKRD